MFGNVRWTFLTKARWMFPPEHKERAHISYIFYCLSLLIHKELHLAIIKGRYLAARLKLLTHNSRNKVASSTVRSSSGTGVPPLGAQVPLQPPQRHLQYPPPKWKHSSKIIPGKGAAVANPNINQLLQFAEQASQKVPPHSAEFMILMREKERTQAVWSQEVLDRKKWILWNGRY